MKQIIRGRIASISSYVEIFLSFVVLLGIVIMAVELIRDIISMTGGVFYGSIALHYETFIGDALKLIIGIEFVKMLAKHTPESVIEVLLFAIARKLVVGNSTTVDIIFGVAAIGVLFAIRKYLYSPSWSYLRANDKLDDENM